jgi:hypothetical protein
MWEQEDRNLILASVLELEQYLSSSQILWRTNQCALPITIGSLLLSERRLSISGKSGESDLIANSMAKLNDIKVKRMSAWESKVQSEFSYRLRLWKNTISDYVDEGGIDKSYPAQVRNRVIIELLRSESRFDDLSGDVSISEIDNQLKRIITPGSFVWEPVLEPLFSPDPFWYLYARLG